LRVDLKTSDVQDKNLLGPEGSQREANTIAGCSKILDKTQVLEMLKTTGGKGEDGGA
jgi:hypothetical protein